MKRFQSPYMGLVVFRAFLVISFLSVGFFCLAASVLLGNETDQLALVAFKAKITDDPLQVMRSWNESIHFCRWHGVICGRRQRVVELNLQSLKLAGSISPYIGNLSFLKLQNNSFSHVIPPELGRLSRLQILYLHNNSISGEIPGNISGCSNLIDIDVSFSRLVGKLPNELGSLSKLQSIHITQNDLTGGIPSSYGNLSALQKLSAAINNFTGSIPDALGHLMNLKIIALGVNRLSGTVPPSIFNLSSITVIDVTDNEINGSLPSDLFITLCNLTFLGVGGNQFTGSLPVSLTNASNLIYLGANTNRLTGAVPSMEKLHKLKRFSVPANDLGSGEAGDLSFVSSLTNATSLHLLSLNGNNFGGVLPESIGNLSTTLTRFYVEYNSISGSIPTGIGNLISLDDLSMSGNQLTGNLPIDIGRLQQLRELDLSTNKFSGIIPSSLGNLSLLLQLDLDDNILHGSIPSSLGKSQNLLSLNLAQNNLSGTIPLQVFGLSSLFYLNLSQNQFIGSLPSEAGNLINLEVLDVSNNMLSGGIPSRLGSCVRLDNLYMDGNFFQGTIPSSLTSLRGIQILDLSRNNLSGKIPKYLGDFVFLQNLNLSFNDFEDAVPTEGNFKNESRISLMGNTRLCGGIPELQLPKCNFEGTEKRRLTFHLKLIISVISGLLGLTLVLCFLFLCWFKKRRQEPSLRSPENSLLEVSYQTLLKATNGFSSANVIGVGSFGSVYKGVIGREGKVVAVKVLNLLRHGALKSFMNECEAFRNIRHRNLVKILTVCSGVDYQGNDFKALVYEFMVNGSLEEWLHPIPREDEEPRNLNLIQRLNIAIDVACALNYLHHHCQESMIHCDLKPSNILLDNEMIGHVGDFGIARFLHAATNDFSINPTSSIGIRGSVGYSAPEYGMGNEVSTYGDVYSYGVLLLEMFTGKRPTDDMFNDSLNIHTFVKIALPERVAEIVDPIILQQQQERESANNTHNQSHVSDDKTLECLISIFRIGIACSAESPRERMDISDVVEELYVIRDYQFAG